MKVNRAKYYTNAKKAMRFLSDTVKNGDEYLIITKRKGQIRYVHSRTIHGIGGMGSLLTRFATFRKQVAKQKRAHGKDPNT